MSASLRPWELTGSGASPSSRVAAMLGPVWAVGPAQRCRAGVAVAPGTLEEEGCRQEPPQSFPSLGRTPVLVVPGSRGLIQGSWGLT